MGRENIEKIERKRFQRKIAKCIYFLEDYLLNIEFFDDDAEKELKKCIKFLKSLN